jgi:hypothetical protein
MFSFENKKGTKEISLSLTINLLNLLLVKLCYVFALLWNLGQSIEIWKFRRFQYKYNVYKKLAINSKEPG